MALSLVDDTMLAQRCLCVFTLGSSRSFQRFVEPRMSANSCVTVDIMVRCFVRVLWHYSFTIRDSGIGRSLWKYVVNVSRNLVVFIL